MDTSSMVPELIIIGLQSYVWIYFLVITIRGDNWLAFISLKDTGSAVIVGLIAFAYVLGIMIDYLASFIPLYNRSEEEETPPSNEKVAYIRAIKTDAYSALDKLFNRIKLLRANIVNILLIGLNLVIYSVRMKLSFWSNIVIIIFISTLLIYISWKVWKKAYKSYLHHVDLTYKFIKESEELNSCGNSQYFKWKNIQKNDKESTANKSVDS